MICPVYCQEDHGGPLSLTEATKLVELMRQRASELVDTNQTSPGSTRAFHNACGQSQALFFTLDLLSRLVLDPSQMCAAFISAAETLERQAAELRQRAEVPMHAPPDGGASRDGQNRGGSC